MFNEGDYIVILKDDHISNNWQNFIIKQVTKNNSIKPELTPRKNNYHPEESYSYFTQTNTWRYATPEEIEEYKRLGIPFNVTRFNNFKLPKNWHVVVTQENIEEVLNWRFKNKVKEYEITNFLESENVVGVTFDSINNNYKKGHNPKSRTKDEEGDYDFGIEITTEQFRKYVLNKQVNEDYSYLINFFRKLNIK